MTSPRWAFKGFLEDVMDGYLITGGGIKDKNDKPISGHSKGFLKMSWMVTGLLWYLCFAGGGIKDENDKPKGGHSKGFLEDVMNGCWIALVLPFLSPLP